MKNKYEKTIILLNLRFSDFYSQDLFKRVKEQNAVRLVAVLDQQFNDRVSNHISPYLDQVHVIASRSKDGFLAEFQIDSLRPIVEFELANAKEVRIFCADEFNLLNAGRLRREYSLSGNNDHDLLVYRDKVKMKEILAKGGIRVPRFRLLQDGDTFQSIAHDVGLPFVIKPLDSCGSHGVYVIRNVSDFLDCQLFLNQSEHKVEVEEFIDGVLYHVDSLTKDGCIEFIRANEYTCPNHDYTRGKVLGSIPLDSDDLLSMRLIDFAKRCLQMLGGINLVNHMELFVNTQGEIIFLEVSARPPGALINLTHRINFSINLTDQDFLMQAGLHADLEHFESIDYAFWALFPLQPGRVSQLSNPTVQSGFDMTWFVKRGSQIQKADCQNIVGKAAQAIFYNKNKEILRQDFEKVKYHQAVKAECYA